MNKLLLITFGIILISLASSLYAGESITIQNTLGTDNLNWLVVDNTSELSVLPVVLVNTTNITISIPSDMPPNSFTIVFLENQTNTIIQTVQVSTGSSRSGGHSKTKIINNTIIKEVPVIEYVNNETIKIIENKTIEEKIVNIGEVKILSVILGLLLVALIIGVLFYFMNRNNNQYNLEGGNEDGRNKTEEKLF
jgi:ATP-dependent Zn protease